MFEYNMAHFLWDISHTSLDNMNKNPWDSSKVPNTLHHIQCYLVHHNPVNTISQKKGKLWIEIPLVHNLKSKNLQYIRNFGHKLWYFGLKLIEFLQKSVKVSTSWLCFDHHKYFSIFIGLSDKISPDFIALEFVHVGRFRDLLIVSFDNLWLVLYSSLQMH